MARVESIEFWRLRNKVGGMVHYRMNGKQYVRSAPLQVKNPRTQAQMAQRKKFSEMISLAGVYVSALYGCFTGISLVQLRRLFVSMNMGVVEVDKDLKTTIDWKKVRLSQGRLTPPKVMVESVNALGEICFVKEKNEAQYGCAPYDKVYAVVVDTANRQSVMYFLLMRAETGRVRIVLPLGEGWKEIFIYVFAVAHDGKSVSDSECIFSGVM